MAACLQADPLYVNINALLFVNINTKVIFFLVTLSKEKYASVVSIRFHADRSFQTLHNGAIKKKYSSDI